MYVYHLYEYMYSTWYFFSRVGETKKRLLYEQRSVQQLNVMQQRFIAPVNYFFRILNEQPNQLE